MTWYELAVIGAKLKQEFIGIRSGGNAMKAELPYETIKRLTRELAEAVKIQVALSTQLAEAKEMQKISSRNVAEACKKANQYRADLEHVQGSDVAMIQLLEAARRELAEAKQNADRGYLEGYGKGKSDLAEAKALDDRRVMAIEAMIKEKNELERKLVEARALSLEWMACHDKLKAGEPYKFPSPPYDRALIEAHNAAIKDAAKVVEGMSGYVWIVRSETAAAIRALEKS